jgi:hypothetical protein
MKKIFLCSLILMLQASTMMNQRIVAKKMHEHAQPTSYKIDRQHIEMSEIPREAHRLHLMSSSYRQVLGGTPFFILACCAMIVTAEAWSKDNPNCNGCLKEHELRQIEDYKAAGETRAAAWAREYYQLRQSCYCERDDYIETIQALQEEVAKLKQDLRMCKGTEKTDL